MSDKSVSKESTCVSVDMTAHVRSSDPSLHRPFSSNSTISGSSNVNRKQLYYNKNKGSRSNDKKQRGPRSGPSAHQKHYEGSKSNHYFGKVHQWSDQRDRPGNSDRRMRDGLTELNKSQSALVGGNSSSSSSHQLDNGEGGHTSTKKTTPVSLNHLLNFTVAPVERRNSASNGGVVPIAMGRRRRTRGHSYNKEQFLQANCQFVVSSSGDYAVHSTDPDKLVDWDSIEQVRLFCHQISSCPICLYPPTAAKITRCGHVYCWSCVLHYLAIGEKKWRKCPICYESVYKNDLKSVTALASRQYKVGDTVTFTLMMKKKGTTQPFPKVEWVERSQGLTTISDPTQQFVKLVLATPTDVLRTITGPERNQLENQLANLGQDNLSEMCFIEAALDELKIRETALKQTEAIALEVEQISQGVYNKLTEAQHTSQSSTVPNIVSKDSGGRVWTSYADDYFHSEFEDPFSDLVDEAAEKENNNITGSSEGEEEEEGSESSQTSTKERNRSPSEEVNNSFPSHVEPNHLSSSGLDKDYSREGVKAEELPFIVTPSDSSGGSPEHSPGRGSQSDSFEGSPQKDPLLAVSSRNSPRIQNSTDVIYFYQAADGQHLYLHPINSKCLAKEYGGLDNAPDVIRATVVEMEQLTMSEDVRSRYRYLSHLPLTCEFVLCELDLKPPTVSKDTLKIFSEDLQKRKQKRLKKKREERRRERKQEPYREPSFYVPTSAHEMTPEKFHDFLSLASSPSLQSTLPSVLSGTSNNTHAQKQTGHLRQEMENSADSRNCEAGEAGDNDSPPSFAQALRGKPTPVWPIRQQQRVQNSALPDHGTHSNSGDTQRVSDCDDEGQSVPSFHDAFNEALLSASASVIAAQSASEGKPGGKTAKKGRKKLVLFSTGGMRGANS